MMRPMHAAIDVGSHSAKLCLARRDTRGQWQRVLEQVEVTGLGLGDPSRQGLDPDGRARTLAALAAMARTCAAHQVAGVVAVGTAVLRSARDAATFLAEVREQTGLPLEVITGTEEARLTYVGAMADLAPCAADGVDLAFDVGGRSTEFAWGRGPRPDQHHSLDLGTITLTAAHGLDGPVTAAVVDDAVQQITAALAGLPPRPPVRRLVGIGATPGSLVAIAQERDIADSLGVHQAPLTGQAVADLVEVLRRLDTTGRRGLPGLHPGRAAVILAGALMVQSITTTWPGIPLIVSATGLREGLLVDRFGA